jgi:hypothetical protein
MSTPSLRSSPWILGAPHSGFARLMLRIRCRISSATFGLPLRGRDFHRQNKRKPARCQRMTVSGLTIAKASLTFGAIWCNAAKNRRSKALNSGRFADCLRKTFSC